MSAEEIGAAFVQHFYTTLDSNPAGLAGLYSPQSVLTFEGAKVEGAAAIVDKYVKLGQLQHNIPQLVKDIQLGPGGNALLILVTGQLKLGDNNPLNFSHTFQLVATGPGQYYVHNELFRLIYG